MSFTVIDKPYNRIVVEELVTDPQVQEFHITQPRMVVERIMPYLFIKGTPTGSLKLEILKADTVIWSVTQGLSDILINCGKTLNTYHGYVSFIGTPLVLNEDLAYTVRLSPVAPYVYASNAHVAWVRMKDSRTSYRNLFPLDFKVVEIRNP